MSNKLGKGLIIGTIIGAIGGLLLRLRAEKKLVQT